MPGPHTPGIVYFISSLIIIFNLKYYEVSFFIYRCPFEFNTPFLQ